MASLEKSESLKNPTKRFYVGNLFNDVSDIELRKLFVKYGSVDQVDIKNKQDIDGNNISTYAFVTICMKSSSDNATSQCIRECNNLKWKKNVIKVQVAQDSFLQRLQKERQESNKSSSTYLGSSMNIINRKNSTKNDNVGSSKIVEANKDIPGSDKMREKTMNNAKITDRILRNGTVDFPSTEEEHNFLTSNKSTAISTLNKRKVYHSSSDEEENTIIPKQTKVSSPGSLVPVTETSKNAIYKKILPNRTKSTDISDDSVDRNQVSPLPKTNVQQKRQYYSSSSDEEDNISCSQNKRKKTVSQNSEFKKDAVRSKDNTFLNKLESFDSSFWQDDNMHNNMISNYEDYDDGRKLSDYAVPSEAVTSKVDHQNDNKSPLVEEIKSKRFLFANTDQDISDSTNLSFSKNMMRFDPSDEQHHKFEVKKLAENMDTNAMKQEAELVLAVSTNENEKNKKFWMSSTFASDLSTKMKTNAAVRGNDIAQNKSTFSFGFESSVQQDINGSKSSGQEDKTALRANTFQDESSEEEIDDSAKCMDYKSSHQDLLIQRLRRKNTELDQGEKFGLKLKQKAVFASVMNSKDGLHTSDANVEPFFFSENDKRFEEGLAFLSATESMDVLRTKFEERRPILAEILRKKMRNKAKKQEKCSFGGVGRKFNPKKKKFGKKFGRNTKK